MVSPGSIVRLQDHVILAAPDGSGSEYQRWRGMPMPTPPRQLGAPHIDRIQMRDGRTRLTVNSGPQEWDTILPSYEYSRLHIQSENDRVIQTWLAQAPSIVQEEVNICGMISHIVLTLAAEAEDKPDSLKFSNTDNTSTKPRKASRTEAASVPEREVNASQKFPRMVPLPPRNSPPTPELNPWQRAPTVGISDRSLSLPQPQSPIDIPCYLFLLPVPLAPARNLSKLVEWKSKDFYYWSYDPKGHRKLSESQRSSLGLPKLDARLSFFYYKWSKDVYDSIAAWQKFKRFDPRTAAFAASLGLPILRRTLYGNAFDGHLKVVIEDGA
ncbi:hypothetical protein AAF712_015846 [Marasmius tenuissimus]|uniref:Uncharacterized protein n=1 Tax=Marasmius tenuissimus TaxID=585030 RepID=A0ABR2Z771_9AGAR